LQFVSHLTLSYVHCLFSSNTNAAKAATFSDSEMINNIINGTC
jgi:hypothetical protein